VAVFVSGDRGEGAGGLDVWMVFFVCWEGGPAFCLAFIETGSNLLRTPSNMW